MPILFRVGKQVIWRKLQRLKQAATLSLGLRKETASETLREPRQLSNRTTLLDPERFGGDGKSHSRPVIDSKKIFKLKQKISSVQNCTLFNFFGGLRPESLRGPPGIRSTKCFRDEGRLRPSEFSFGQAAHYVRHRPAGPNSSLLNTVLS